MEAPVALPYSLLNHPSEEANACHKLNIKPCGKAQVMRCYGLLPTAAASITPPPGEWAVQKWTEKQKWTLQPQGSISWLQLLAASSLLCQRRTWARTIWLSCSSTPHPQKRRQQMFIVLDELEKKKKELKSTVTSRWPAILWGHSLRAQSCYWLEP